MLPSLWHHAVGSTCVPAINWSYSASKLTQVLDAYEINRRWFKDGMTAAADNPDPVNSEIWRNDAWIVNEFLYLFGKAIFLDADQGSSTTTAGAMIKVSVPDDLVYLTPYGPPILGWIRDFFGIYGGYRRTRIEESYNQKKAAQLWNFPLKERVDKPSNQKRLMAFLE